MVRLLATLLAATAPVGLLRFSPAPGWYVGNGHSYTCPGTPAPCKESWSWTGTVRWRDARASNYPYRTTSSLGPNGVVIAAFVIHDNPDPKESRIAWPPRVRASEVHAGYRATGIAGLADRIGVYQLFARLGPYTETFVSVYFGRPHPTAAQLRAANARLTLATP